MILIAIGNCNLDALFEPRLQMGVSLILPFLLYILNVILHKEESIIKCLLLERQDKLMIFKVI